MIDTKDTKILVVDDEPDIIEFLTYNLKKEGFNTYSANNGRDALKLTSRILPHLILLDVMMPDMDGIETCEKLRENPVNEDTMIVFLTARGEDYSQIAGFQAGGDDYITKPVRPKVLATRLKALMKRYGQRKDSAKEENDRVLRFNDLVIDMERYLVFSGEKELMLPRKEFNLLQLLTSKPSRVFTRDEIFEQLWGTDIFVGDRTIDVYIRKLREKIGENKIHTIKGVGYKFEP
ncbi:MAG: response regulator transcription factor [Bacteroidales bacterium]|nr:response regulator transcription factor [Bacteroidales bacterium]MBN2819469.1 response regulator transcription factor [Bacteroidales bacterium]